VSGCTRKGIVATLMPGDSWRWRVVCGRCGTLVHEGTTNPRQRITDHERETRLTPISVAALGNGLWRLHWVDGGSSVAAIGRNNEGGTWVAPTNWVSIVTTWDDATNGNVWQAERIEHGQS